MLYIGIESFGLKNIIILTEIFGKKNVICVVLYLHELFKTVILMLRRPNLSLNEPRLNGSYFDIFL